MLVASPGSTATRDRPLWMRFCRCFVREEGGGTTEPGTHDSLSVGPGSPPAGDQVTGSSLAMSVASATIFQTRPNR
jgi:hypothetical protein